MTAVYSIPKSISERISFRSKPVNANNIRAVVPTYRDWDGLRVTLDSLLSLQTPPKRISVANDNADDSVPDWLREYQVELVNYPGNCGPATARNKGFGLRGDVPFEKVLGILADAARGVRVDPDYIRNGYCPELKYADYDSRPDQFTWESEFDWIYFTDCGCRHDPRLFLKFEEAWRESGDCCVAICGPITGEGSGLINDYMTEQGILNPPLERNLHGVYIPQAIVTANALVAGLPFAFLGGFDPVFQEAAGEDLDLGIRLRELGMIAWASGASTAHRFDESEDDFCRRFRRYGRGNRKLELKHRLPCMRARPFNPDRKDDAEHQRLAQLALEAMQAGYDEAISDVDRGVIRIKQTQ